MKLISFETSAQFYIYDSTVFYLRRYYLYLHLLCLIGFWFYFPRCF